MTERSDGRAEEGFIPFMFYLTKHRAYCMSGTVMNILQILINLILKTFQDRMYAMLSHVSRVQLCVTP